MFTLRPYQQQAVEKLLWSRNLEGADVCVLPPGAGKSLIIAELARKLGKPVLILQPTKEILEQNLSKLKHYVADCEIGVYSASVGRKDINTYTFATIQSIYKKPEDFAHFDFVIIDECHLVNHKNLNTMFMQFLVSIGNPKVVGLSATPYRLDIAYEKTSDGFIAHTATKLINRMGRQRFWHRIVFNITLDELVKDGYLAELEYIDHSIVDHKNLPTNKSESDFDLGEFDELVHKEEQKIFKAIAHARELSKHTLVFCSSVEQAEWLSAQYFSAAVVSAKTKKKDREKIIAGFRNGGIQMVFNVGVLTTGFDFPELDGIVMIRPTRSMALYYQMAGRGVRVSPNKKACTVIDVSGNVKALGRISSIKLVKRELWELESETGSWHNTPLYSFKVIK